MIFNLKLRLLKETAVKICVFLILAEIRILRFSWLGMDGMTQKPF